MKIENNLHVPIIAESGNSSDAIRAALLNAILKLRLAEIALGRATPHWNDYAHEGRVEFKKATGQHRVRLRRLELITQEYREMLTAVRQQIDSLETRVLMEQEAG